MQTLGLIDPIVPRAYFLAASGGILVAFHLLGLHLIW